MPSVGLLGGTGVRGLRTRALEAENPGPTLHPAFCRLCGHVSSGSEPRFPRPENGMVLGSPGPGRVSVIREVKPEIRLLHVTCM